MTQDQRWLAQYESAIDFIKTHGRSPSKFDGAEREIRNWMKHQRKLLNAGTLKAERVERLTIVDLRRDSAELMRAWLCARCSVG